MDTSVDFTEDGILDGKVRLRQPRRGYRVAIDPILLAAAVPASPGDSILDVGIGTGAVSLSLAARVPSLALTGIDSHAALVELARQNAQLNNVQIQLLTGDVLRSDDDDSLGGNSWNDLPPFDHVVSNPPFWEQGRARVSAAPTSAAAAIMPRAALGAWVEFCVGKLASTGRLTLILPIGRLEETLASLEALGQSAVVLPLLPRTGECAKRVIVQSKSDPTHNTRTLSGVPLHTESGGYADEIEEILRGRAGLSLAETSDASQAKT